jgi:hypothetical protein
VAEHRRQPLVRLEAGTIDVGREPLQPARQRRRHHEHLRGPVDERADEWRHFGHALRGRGSRDQQACSGVLCHSGILPELESLASACRTTPDSVSSATDDRPERDEQLEHDRRHAGRVASRRVHDQWLDLLLRLERFVAYTNHLYDRLYDDTLEEAYAFRRTAAGVEVWNEDQGRLINRHADDYVSKLIRAVRNSSHGLFDQVASPRHRNFLATHTGTVPAVLPDLAALLALALVADAENLCAGTWFRP